MGVRGIADSIADASGVWAARRRSPTAGTRARSATALTRPEREQETAGDDSDRLFLVDDHRPFLSGVRRELGALFEIVATGAPSAIEGIRGMEPGVVRIDMPLPGGGGRAVVEAVHPHPAVRFLALSASDALEGVVAVVRAGERRLRHEDHPPDDLSGDIWRVTEGDAVFSPRLAGFVLGAFAGPADRVIDLALDLLLRVRSTSFAPHRPWYTYQGGGRQLHISTKTVETHISAL